MTPTKTASDLARDLRLETALAYALDIGRRVSAQAVTYCEVARILTEPLAERTAAQGNSAPPADPPSSDETGPGEK